MWVQRQFGENDFTLDGIYHQFFDDTHYAERPEDHLGESLINAEEVAAIQRMVAALSALLGAAGPREVDRTDAEYIRLPEWAAVRKAAKALHALLVANDASMAAGEHGGRG